MNSKWIILVIVLIASYTAWGQNGAFYLLPADRQIVVLWGAIEYLRADIKQIGAKLDTMAASLAETREEIAEMRGRQNAATGVAAGVPTTLAGILFWWLRRKNGKKKDDGT